MNKDIVILILIIFLIFKPAISRWNEYCDITVDSLREKYNLEKNE